MPKRFSRALCWIRRDLRLEDNRALAFATAEAKEAVVVFVFDTVILNALQDRDDRRVTFIHRSLQELRDRLGDRLVVLHGDPAQEIPALAKRIGADVVVAARDYDPYAVARDAKVESLLQVKDSVILERGEVLNQSGAPFRTYTPYARAWRTRFQTEIELAEADLSTLIEVPGKFPSLEDLGFREAQLWLEPGEHAAQERLSGFSVGSYAEERDFPALQATSGLSVHLRFGTVSIRACVREALKHHEAGEKWLGELIWRDFYQDILANFPQVVDEPFQPQYRDLPYPGTEEDFEAWCQGQTGYPIVDAAMRCFNATGWMHNRLRMIVASFLTKDLLVDYRKGEAYFARYLLDFDLASNNGNWQWAASVGCDAQPYFRIFNPILQSKKFDPEGKFIRTWIPELAHLDGDAIHWPHAAKNLDYPGPIVDHALQRDRAIKLLASAAK